MSRAAVARRHGEWLSLVEVSGPFLTLPVLERAFPHGLEPTPQELVDDLRLAYAEYTDDPNLQPRWIDWVLYHLLGFPEDVVKTSAAIGHGFTHRVPEHGVVLRPEYVVVDDPGAAPTRGRLLVVTWPPGTPLDARPDDDR